MGVDATLRVKKDTKTSGTVFVEKQRDGEDNFELLRFEAKTISLEPDTKGRSVTGQVIVPRVAVGITEIEKRMSAGQQRLLRLIDAALAARAKDKKNPQPETADFDEDFMFEAASSWRRQGEESASLFDLRRRKHPWRQMIDRHWGDLKESEAVSEAGNGLFFRNIKAPEDENEEVGE
jgi:hypothetical protein